MNLLNETFTSTGAKFFAHQQVMADLRDGRGRPVVSHVMLTDVCNHSCAFCSVQARAGDSLPFGVVVAYLGILLRYGLKAVILSGGGNPILYRCKVTGADFNDVVNAIHGLGLEIGLITNGMPLKKWDWQQDINGGWWQRSDNVLSRQSWVAVRPSTLDKLTWVRISMSGLDHKEREVYVPDVDTEKTTLGFSYVAHDLYVEPADPHHGKVSRPLDLLSGDPCRPADETFEARLTELTRKFTQYATMYEPRYIRLLPNCLEPALIPERCETLQYMADAVNTCVGRDCAFVQYKPPAPPKACYLGYVHPVLNCDGYVYPCDSCVLNESAGHTFANPWRVCHWSEVARIYDEPVRSLIEDPSKLCPGCVFHESNELLRSVREGGMGTPPSRPPEHVNFI